MTTEVYKSLASIAKQVAIDAGVPCRVKELDVLDPAFQTSVLRVQVSVSMIKSRELPNETDVEALVSASILAMPSTSPLSIFAIADDYQRRFAKPCFVTGHACVVSDEVKVTHQTLPDNVRQTLVQATYRGVL